MRQLIEHARLDAEFKARFRPRLVGSLAVLVATAAFFLLGESPNSPVSTDPRVMLAPVVSKIHGYAKLGLAGAMLIGGLYVAWTCLRLHLFARNHTSE